MQQLTFETGHMDVVGTAHGLLGSGGWTGGRVVGGWEVAFGALKVPWLRQRPPATCAHVDTQGCMWCMWPHAQAANLRTL